MLSQDLITEYVNLKNRIYIAYSGGPDSTALLNILADMNTNTSLDIIAVHVNHNLSKESKEWENHCKEACSILDIELIIESIEVVPDGGGVESASRKARYKVFENLLQENDQILLAHHSDDVAETVFMRLLRGTGVDGIEGPKLHRIIGKGNLIRPFLKISKKDILSYLNENNIKYIKDDSNNNNELDRNFLRNEIFPLLEERWNGFTKRINRTSSIFRDRNNMYTALINEKYSDLIGEKIEIKKIKGLSNSIISDILRYSIRQCNIALPNSKIMEEIIKTFINSSPGPKSIVTWSRSDKEEAAGKITYQKGFIIISKR